MKISVECQDFYSPWFTVFTDKEAYFIIIYNTERHSYPFCFLYKPLEISDCVFYSFDYISILQCTVADTEYIII